MIEISEARKYARCQSCFSENNVRTVAIYTDPQQRTVLQV